MLKKTNSLTSDFKYIVCFAEKCNNKAVGRKSGVNKALIRYWRKQKYSLGKVNKNMCEHSVVF